ncbi:MAG: GMP/IMP nucleotidase [Pseudomonadota bacterium]
MIDWRNIETVLLDMDGTLLDLHYDNHFWMEYLPRAYAAEHAVAEEEARDMLLRNFEVVRGTLPWYSLDHWTAKLQMDIPSLKREIKHMIRVRPFTMEFLAWLKLHRFDVLLVTNAHRETYNIKMAEVDISEWFDRVVISHDLDSPKEHQEFWDRLQVLHPFDPEKTLLIDDTESVLEAAQNYGIRHLLTLLQPDSSRQKRIDLRFPGIHHFDEIMPDLTA